MRTDLAILSKAINEVCHCSEFIDRYNIKINGREFNIKDGLVKSKMIIFRYNILKSFFFLSREEGFIQLSDNEITLICQRYEYLSNKLK